jgi:hypothetical protein
MGSFGPLWNPRTRTVISPDFVTRHAHLTGGTGFDDQMRNFLRIVVSTTLRRMRRFGEPGFRKRPAIYVCPANKQG